MGEIITHLLLDLWYNNGSNKRQAHLKGFKAVLFLQIKYAKSAVKVIESLDKVMKLRIKKGIRNTRGRSYCADETTGNTRGRSLCADETTEKV